MVTRPLASLTVHVAWDTATVMRSTRTLGTSSSGSWIVSVLRRSPLATVAVRLSSSSMIVTVRAAAVRLAPVAVSTMVSSDAPS